MKRFGIDLIGLVLGYLDAAAAGYFLTGALSANSHDRSVEAAMTGAFVFGPIGAVMGFVVGFILGRPSSHDGTGG